MRDIPNPESIILKSSIIGGAGLSVPPAICEPPNGMAAVLLYVPIEQIINKTPMQIQNDIGLPWHMDGGDSFWFEELGK